MAKRVMLTGGAGFIGSHVGEELLRAHNEVVCIDNFDDFYPRRWKDENISELMKAGKPTVLATDIRDFEALRLAFYKYRPELVVHLAAKAGVRPSIEQPALYEQVNVAGTLNLLELCKQHGTKRFIFGSSSSVYGASSSVPFSESQMELRPISPYAATKLSGELMCYTYAHLFDLECICLRFFTVYGPRQRPDLAIRKFFTLIDSGTPIPFFGDGTSGRDYTFVDDIVKGVMAAVHFDLRAEVAGRPPFDVFNLGNSHPVTLSELVAQIESVVGKPAILDKKPMQPGDVPITWADTSKSKALLGFAPETPLQNGLSRFWEWYRDSRRAVSGAQ